MLNLTFLILLYVLPSIICAHKEEISWRMDTPDYCLSIKYIEGSKREHNCPHPAFVCNSI